jgi:predicted DNA-binding transcriptional regulator AlpA
MQTTLPNVTGCAALTPPTSISPDQLIDAMEAARQLRLKVQTLASWRAEGRGPRFVKIGRACFYIRADLERWIAAQIREPGGAVGG